MQVLLELNADSSLLAKPVSSILRDLINIDKDKHTIPHTTVAAIRECALLAAQDYKVSRCFSSVIWRSCFTLCAVCSAEPSRGCADTVFWSAAHI